MMARPTTRILLWSTLLLFWAGAPTVQLVRNINALHEPMTLYWGMDTFHFPADYPSTAMKLEIIEGLKQRRVTNLAVQGLRPDQDLVAAPDYDATARMVMETKPRTLAQAIEYYIRSAIMPWLAIFVIVEGISLIHKRTSWFQRNV
jgi:hypothetical protein